MLCEQISNTRAKILRLFKENDALDSLKRWLQLVMWYLLKGGPDFQQGSQTLDYESKLDQNLL